MGQVIGDISSFYQAMPSPPNPRLRQKIEQSEKAKVVRIHHDISEI